MPDRTKQSTTRDAEINKITVTPRRSAAGDRFDVSFGGKTEIYVAKGDGTLERVCEINFNSGRVSARDQTGEVMSRGRITVNFPISRESKA